MTIGLTMERFPFQLRGKKIQITEVELFLKFKDTLDPATYRLDHRTPTTQADYVVSHVALTMYLTSPRDPAPQSISTELISNSTFLNGLPHGTTSFPAQPGLGNRVLEARDHDV
jgi:hypothetical protein